MHSHCFIKTCPADPIYFALNNKGKWLCMCATHFTQHAKRVAPRNVPSTAKEKTCSSHISNA